MENSRTEDLDLAGLIKSTAGVIRKRIVLILVCFVAVFSFAMYKMSQGAIKKQSSHIIVSNYRFSDLNEINADLNGVALDLVTHFANYIENKNHDELAKFLGLDAHKVANIDEIMVMPTTGEEVNLKLDYSFFETDYTYEVSQAIVNHLNKDQFVALNLKLISERDQSMQDMYAGEVAELDEVIQKYESGDENQEDLVEGIYPHRFDVKAEKTALLAKSKLDKAYYLTSSTGAIELKESTIMSVLKYFSYAVFLSLTLVVVAEVIQILRS